MKAISFFAVLMISLSLNASGQRHTCESLHTGNFKIVSEESGTTYITRNQKVQIEKNEQLGFEVIFDIKWIDDCTYELRPKSN